MATQHPGDVLHWRPRRTEPDHLANDWLAGEYRRACEAIDAQAVPAGA